MAAKKRKKKTSVVKAKAPKRRKTSGVKAKAPKRRTVTRASTRARSSSTARRSPAKKRGRKEDPRSFAEVLAASRAALKKYRKKYIAKVKRDPQGVATRPLPKRRRL